MKRWNNRDVAAIDPSDVNMMSWWKFTLLFSRSILLSEILWKLFCVKIFFGIILWRSRENFSWWIVVKNIHIDCSQINKVGIDWSSSLNSSLNASWRSRHYSWRSKLFSWRENITYTLLDLISCDRKPFRFTILVLCKVVQARTSEDWFM